VGVKRLMTIDISLVFIMLFVCEQKTVNCLAEFFKPPKEVYAVQSVRSSSSLVAEQY